MNRLLRISKKPPSYILWRLMFELKAELGRFWEPFYSHWLTQKRLLKYFNCNDIKHLWTILSHETYFLPTDTINKGEFENITGISENKIIEKAQKAIDHRVTLLGLENTYLGENIDWGRDYKTGRTWPLSYFRSIDYINFDAPSDVKIPWEISRFQWAIPLGQAYRLTTDDQYALKARALLEDWIHKNPYAKGVNWACTMEVAIRLVVWSWFFHVFKNAPSWQDEGFQYAFLKYMYLHAVFTRRHLEKSDINGNHYIADALGLVVAGSFFGQTAPTPKAWMTLGWEILTDEYPKQVYDDGVDFEGSIPYHRLAFEIFYLGEKVAKRHVKIPHDYKERLTKMIDFVHHYRHPDGSCPLVGDNDDGRILPFGLQPLNDHGYILHLESIDKNKQLPQDATEAFWYLAAEERQTISIQSDLKCIGTKSKAYPNGGIYIMKDTNNHVVIQCSPLGLGGRGGHCHNDSLSFELSLEGEKLITDSGSFVYTADYRQRNIFRSTSSHNTPYVVGVEINTIPNEKLIWSLKDEAQPICLDWHEDDSQILFRGSHIGYTKLSPPLTVERKIVLYKGDSHLQIQDAFQSPGKYDIHIPFHLMADVKIEQTNKGIFLHKNGKTYSFYSPTHAHNFEIHDSWVSENYGQRIKNKCILFKVCSVDTFSLSIISSPIKKSQ